MNGEVLAAIEDFELALFSEPAQAINTLLSYTLELRGASNEDLGKIAQIFCSYLERSPPCEAADGWTLRCEIKNFLTSSFFKAHPILAAQLHGSWQDSLGSVLLNLQNASLDEYLARLNALQDFLPKAVTGAAASLQQGRCPCTNNTLRTLMQAALFSTSLPTTQSNPQLEHDLETLLGTSLATFLAQNLATNLHPQACASLFQNIFEAALETIQAAATIHSIAQLDSESQTLYWKKAWGLLSTLQRVSSTVAVSDLFWGVYVSTIFQLSTLVSQHGRDHPALSCVVKLLCNPESAIVLLQCLLAYPTTTAAAPPAPAAGNSRAAAGTGNSKSIKSVFRTALVLLRDSPEAYIAACCDMLTPALNAALGTRIEALHAIKLAIDQHSSDTEYYWTQDALEKLHFALSRDPSVRLRRKAIELLQYTLRKAHFPETAAAEEATILAAVAERCTDQDAEVQKIAYMSLNSVQFNKLMAVLSNFQWSRILGHGLAAGKSHTSGGREAATSNAKHAREIFSASKSLFTKYLRQDENGEQQENEDENMSEAIVESKAVNRMQDLINSNFVAARTLLSARTDLTSLLAEIVTERDLTIGMNQT